MSRYGRRLARLGAAMCLSAALALTAGFAAGTEEDYVLSFRAGAYGTFTQAAEDYLATLGSVERSEATGNLYLHVAAGESLPEDLEQTLCACLTLEEGYYYRGGLAAAGTVTRDQEYVADYGVLHAVGEAYIAPVSPAADAGGGAAAAGQTQAAGEAPAAAAAETVGGTTQQADAVPSPVAAQVDGSQAAALSAFFPNGAGGMGDDGGKAKTSVILIAAGGAAGAAAAAVMGTEALAQRGKRD